MGKCEFLTERVILKYKEDTHAIMKSLTSLRNDVEWI